MISRHFFAWAQNVAPGERAEGVASLVQDYLHMDLAPEERREVEDIFTVLLDDPSILVRRAMAEGLARALAAPHHIILALALDQPDIAAVVLGRSPLLSEIELIECVQLGGAAAQIAIAERPELPASVAQALVDAGSYEAVMALALNGGACISTDGLLSILARFGDDGAMREAILARRGLPGLVRINLAGEAGRALTEFAVGAGWLSAERCDRLVRESREKVMVTVAADSAEQATGAPLNLARHLRVSGSLTPGLLLRGLLSADRSLFEAALCELSGLPFSKVAALIARSESQGFHALYQRAGLPGWLLPAFQAALAAQREFDLVCDEANGARLMRPLVDHVLDACAGMTSPEAGKLIALLRRFQAEAARDEARSFTRNVAAEPEPVEPPIVIDLHIERRTLLAA